MIVDAVRWATDKVDEAVVSPVTARLASSVANPAVLSFLLWDRLKTMTPQRARDLTRVLATALGNAVGVLGAERGRALGAATGRLQSDFTRAATSRSGRDVLVNGVATAAKVAQALNTPESKAATQQLFTTLQSLVDFFASDDGRRLIASTSECVTSVTEVAASPEASIFLAELATNMCHAMESEELRRQQEEQEAQAKPEPQQTEEERETLDVHEQEQRDMEAEDKHPIPISPTSSMADTRWSFETESMFSEAPGTPMTGMYTPRASDTTRASMSSSSPPLPAYPRRRNSTTASTTSAPAPSPAEKVSAFRSARIEKEVLLKMGVDPSMLSEVQRVLDIIAAEEEDKARVQAQREQEQAEFVAGLMVPEPTEEDQEAPEAEASIAFAFEAEQSGAEVDEEPERPQPVPVMLPEWHEQPVREALRRRHAQAQESSEQRDGAERQAREMAAVLAQRQVQYGELQPMDVAACRVIAQMIVYGVGLFLLLAGYLITRSLFN